MVLMGALSEMVPESQQHTVIFELRTGTNGEGQPIYGATVTLVGFLMAKRRLVRTAMTQTNTGDEVIAEATFLTDRGPSIPDNSRVTLPDGSISRVLTVLDQDGGALPVPSHLEILIA
jgi:hypothetical protein